MSASSRRYVVNTEPLHPTGNQFKDARYISETPLVVEGNISPKQAIDQSRLLLQHCGVNPAEVLLQTGP